MSCNLDDLFYFFEKELPSLHKSHKLTDMRNLRDFFKINISDVNWVEEEYTDDLKNQKEVELRNDSPAVATGTVETKPGNVPSCQLEIIKGLICAGPKSQTYKLSCHGCDFQTKLELPPKMQEFTDGFLSVDLTKEVDSANNPIPMEVSVKVDLPPNVSKVGKVEVDEIVYKGTFTARAQPRFKIKIESDGGSIDFTPSDALEIKKKFPLPFQKDARGIFWIVEGKLRLRFDHRKMVKIA